MSDGTMLATGGLISLSAVTGPVRRARHRTAVSVRIGYPSHSHGAVFVFAGNASVLLGATVAEYFLSLYFLPPPVSPQRRSSSPKNERPITSPPDGVTAARKSLSVAVAGIDTTEPSPRTA